VIPSKINRREPGPSDQAMHEVHRERNLAERGFGKANPFRGFATWHDKLRDVYLGLFRLIFGFLNVEKLTKP
jgi:transposase